MRVSQKQVKWHLMLAFNERHTEKSMDDFFSIHQINANTIGIHNEID